MVDAALIQQCADRALKPEIVQMFVARAGAPDPFAVTVRSGNRVVPVPKPATPDQAMELIRQYVGRNIVRVGITQYPAGVGVIEAGELKPDLVDACANLRMGTALFAKVYRIVTKWYGNPNETDVQPQVFDDAIIAWQTGYFEGTTVFRTPDPLEVKLEDPRVGTESNDYFTKPPASVETKLGEKAEPIDPAKADIRIDLSGIGGRQK